jgi:uncharacterized protein (DUF2336 family)
VKTVDAVSPPLADVALSADIVRRFLGWMQRAPAEARAQAVSALARAYLYSPLPEAVRAEAAVALTSILDDPSARVRRALAEALASAVDAPRHIILALASDQSDVARIVLARSPALDDTELVDCAAIGDAVARAAVARRARLGPGAAAALAEIGEFSTVLALVGNLDAELTGGVLRRVFDRFGDRAEIREGLLARGALPAALRADIAAATASALTGFVAGANWLDPGRAERIARDAREQATVAIAASCPPRELAELVARLRGSGALTVALLMRALLGGDLGLFRQTLVEMSGLPERRVAGFLRDGRGQGFAAIYAKAGLPPHFLPAFRAALGVLADGTHAGAGHMSHAITMRLIQSCEKLGDARLAPVLTMLWRFAGESAREEAREFAADAAYPEPLLVASRIELQASTETPPVHIEIEAVNENFAPRVEIDAVPEAAMADAA